MARKFSVLFLVFGILNILVALGPPCAGCVGVSFFVKRPEGMFLNGRDVGPQLMQHLDKNATGAKAEAFAAVGCNGFTSLLLVLGAIGLFIGHEWGRWLSIGAGVLMLLTLCMHDAYQVAVLRPAMSAFLDQQLPAGPEREVFKVGFMSTFFLWLWINPFLMLYLAAMCITLGLNAVLRRSAADDGSGTRRRRRDRHDRDDRDDDD